MYVTNAWYDDVFYDVHESFDEMNARNKMYVDSTIPGAYYSNKFCWLYSLLYIDHCSWSSLVYYFRQIYLESLENLIIFLWNIAAFSIAPYGK